MNPVVFNSSPFAQQGFLLPDSNGQLFYAMVICATFQFDECGEPYPATVQVPVPAGDELYGEPGRSSVRRDSAATPAKRVVDLVVQATCHAPGGQPMEQVLVGVRIGDWTRVLSVTGNRHWSGLLRNQPSAPQPFTQMPMRYERAYGGTRFDTDGTILGWYPPNPVGVGHAGATLKLPDSETELPNIELPNDRISTRGDSCTVAGLGVVARHWVPRVGYAGTYDSVWQARRHPALPVDFDDRFYQCAPALQQFPDALAGQSVLLRNLTEEGTWQCRMPTLDVPINVLRTGSMDTHAARVDTIHINAEERTITLTARHCITEPRSLGPVSAILLGEVSPGWLRARLHNKRYVGRNAPRMAAP